MNLLNNGEVILNEIYLNLVTEIEIVIDQLDSQMRVIKEHIRTLQNLNELEQILNLNSEKPLNNLGKVRRLSWLNLGEMNGYEGLITLLERIEYVHPINVTPQIPSHSEFQSILANRFPFSLVIDVFEHLMEDSTITSIDFQILIRDNGLSIIFRDNGVHKTSPNYSKELVEIISLQVRYLKGSIEKKRISISCNETMIKVPVKIYG